VREGYGGRYSQLALPLFPELPRMTNSAPTIIIRQETHFHFDGTLLHSDRPQGGVGRLDEKERRALREYLSRADLETLRDFAADVIKAYEESLIEGNTAPLTVCLDEWLETLDVTFQPGVAERIKQAEKDLAEGLGRIWLGDTP